MPKRVGVSLLAFFTIGLAASSDAEAASPTLSEQASLAGAAETFFGYSVAVDGDTAVVGAINDGLVDGNLGNGAAYVFVRSNGSWSQQAELRAADGQAGDEFGYSVAVSGNTVLVGAASKSNTQVDAGGANQGSVYVFTRSGTSWSQVQEFTSADGAANDCFGCAVALSGTTALVGAPGHLGGIGAAYAYTNPASGPSLAGEFGGQANGAQFGFSIALSSDATTAIVGAWGANSETGQAYVLTSGAGTWGQQAVLTASAGQAGDRFGYSVAVSGNTALVGAYGSAGLQGSAYVFTRSGTAWTQQTPALTAPDGAANDYFGSAVALNGGTALIGAYETGAGGAGVAYVFASQAGGWAEQAELTAPGSGRQSFGYAVALSTTSAAVGAFSTANDSGAAFLFAPSAPPPVPALGGSLAVLLLAVVLGGIGAWARPSRGDALS